MNLIIVESPTKARTLNKFLGNEVLVEATYGHIRDLPEKKVGIDIEKGFKPDYVQTARQRERTQQIAVSAGKSDEVYLATDPDREGEAIAWHVAEMMKDKKNKSGKKIVPQRIVFHEITKQAIEEALKSPKKVDEELVNAQQARRILDRLVGYKLSPLLWRKIRKGLSAGRVQSVAVRLVVEKEREIEAFKPEEYWNVRVQLLTLEKDDFEVVLVAKDGEKFRIENGNQAQEVEENLRTSGYRVAEMTKREIKKLPTAPFTTSTLQQAAANKLGWSAKRTMQTAQSLYENGFITYHRTDSTNIAEEAVTAIAKFIEQEYGREYVVTGGRKYKTKSKVAQEAHEAIRPTDLISKLASSTLTMNREESRLYSLIWKRFVASQMAEAVGVSVKVSVEAKTGKTIYGLEAKGETITFPGWMKIYDQKESKEKEDEEDEKQEHIPDMSTGEELNFKDLTKEQKFTLPPARYNDASLIKTLEEMGIGRPSTYAPILSTIQDRQYVEKVEKRFRPTSLGIAVNDFLVKYFADEVDYQFTAEMEEKLDEVANGEREWQPVIAEFYKPFEKKLNEANEASPRVKVEVETTGEKCPVCLAAGAEDVGEVVVRIGKFGKFLACSRYPECKYKANYVNKTGVPCPKCQGEVILRKTRTGKTFYGCANYPKCDFASWNKPITPTAQPEAQ